MSALFKSVFVFAVLVLASSRTFAKNHVVKMEGFDATFATEGLQVDAVSGLLLCNDGQGGETVFRTRTVKPIVTAQTNSTRTTYYFKLPPLEAKFETDAPWFGPFDFHRDYCHVSLEFHFQDPETKQLKSQKYALDNLAVIPGAEVGYRPVNINASLAIFQRWTDAEAQSRTMTDEQWVNRFRVDGGPDFHLTPAQYSFVKNYYPTLQKILSGTVVRYNPATRSLAFSPSSEIGNSYFVPMALDLRAQFETYWQKIDRNNTTYVIRHTESRSSWTGKVIGGAVGLWACIPSAGLLCTLGGATAGHLLWDRGTVVKETVYDLQPPRLSSPVTQVNDLHTVHHSRDEFSAFYALMRLFEEQLGKRVSLTADERATILAGRKLYAPGFDKLTDVILTTDYAGLGKK